jgi:hypothetical protein
MKRKLPSTFSNVPIQGNGVRQHECISYQQYWSISVPDPTQVVHSTLKTWQGPKEDQVHTYCSHLKEKVPKHDDRCLMVNIVEDDN